MDYITIGTAGHVDHGKTTLIKALTGIETDTTNEEKERGMSINIGFAYFDLPDGRRAGVVDVPGHEKFIKNMMAGLAGLNLVLLVIDASEGIMPQTKEHIDILQLLGIKDYVVVITKVGLVDEELLELVEDDIREQFVGTHLEAAPVIRVDSVSGFGIDTLKEKIHEVSQAIESKNTLLPPRMHVDRAFSVKGFGTVVTGTLIEGQLKMGDELVVYPSGVETKIRGIEVHGEKREMAYAGQRTAINLAHVKVADIGRGDTLAMASTMDKSWMIDVKVKVLPDGKAIKLWDRLRFHVGTKEVLCRAVPLGQEEILPGEEGFLQLRLEEQVVTMQTDKCILRSYSPMRTIAGAIVLDTNPKKHRRFNADMLEGLKIKESGKVEDLICDYVGKQTSLLVSVADITNHMGLDNLVVQDLLEELVEQKQLIELDGRFVDGRKYITMKEEVASHLEKYHKSYKLRSGMPKEELRSKFPQMTKGKEFDLFLGQLAREEVIKNAEAVSLFDFEVTYNPYQIKDKEKIEKMLKGAWFIPTEIADITGESNDVREVIESLNHKSLIRLDADTIIAADAYHEAVDKVKEFITTNEKMTLAEFRDMLDTSRKFAMIMLEYMDKHKITRRVENWRVLG